MSRYLIPILIILLSLNIVIFDKDFYEKEMPVYNETEVTNLQHYFLFQDLNTNNYSEKEISHLNDVRNLIHLSWLIILIQILILIFVKKEFFYGGLFSLIFILLLSLTLLSFQDSFTAFHEILFTNDNWLLPENSALIQLFPESFFQECFKQIIFIDIIFSLLSMIIGYKQKHIFYRL
jgi:integral membrane protein (TIGR01906 family)